MASLIVSNFDNESATGFVSDVITTGYGLIRTAFERVREEAGLVDCEEALVAAELVAGALGNPAHDIPEEAAEWISQTFPPGSDAYLEMIEMSERAADAIDFITAGSELRELWEETPDFEAWIATQVNLQQRLLGN
jgi:hypothetical protein